MSPAIAEFQAVNISTIVLLLIKLTILLSLVLLIYRFAVRRSASYRHAVLGAGVVLTPLLLIGHFLFPTWSLPIQEFSVESAPAVEQQLARNPDFQASSATFQPGANTGFTDDLPKPANCDSLREENSSTPETSGSESGEFWLCPTNTNASSISPGHSSLSLPVIIVLVWAVVAIWMLLRLGVAWLVMGIRAKKSVPITASDLNRHGVPDLLVTRLLTQNIRIKASRCRSQMPLGIGLFRKTILLPKSCRKWNRFEWQSVLLHEKAHFDRGDCWLNLAARVQQSLLWFHPLATLLVRMLRNESELACDDRVIESGICKVRYASVLLQVASRGRYNRSASLVSVAMSDSAPLETRMNAILNGTSSRQPASFLSLLCMVLTVVLMLVPVATARLTTPSVNEIATPSDVQEFAEEEILFNVSLLPNEGEVSYSDEFIGTSDDTLVIKSGGDVLEIEFADIETIWKKSRTASQWNVQTTEGDVHKGTVLNETVFFSLDADSVDDGGMGQSVAPDDIYLATRIRYALLRAGSITQGVAASKLSYYLRAPSEFGESRNWPALVLLHQNRGNAKQYIEWIVETWPEIAKRYVLIGINGERRHRDLDDRPNDPAFSYTGLSYVGAGSNYGALPGTDRESPAPIAEAITELRERFGFSRLFVAGHGTSNYTSGGNNAFHIQTYFPEVADGVVVLDGAVLIQCDVNEFHDIELQERQRDTPLVIVDGEREGRSRQGFAEWAHGSYLDSSFPMLKYLHNGAGNRFTGMPFDQAIAWLEKITVEQPEEAILIAEQFVNDGELRDAIAVLNRFSESELGASVSRPALSRVRQAIAKGTSQIKRFEECLDGNHDHERFEEFLEFRKTWEFAPEARQCMAVFNQLREKQNAEAKELLNQARKLDRERGGGSGESSELYRKIIDQYYASKYYRRARSILAARDKK